MTTLNRRICWMKTPVCFVVLCISVVPAGAGTPGDKKPLDHDSYDRWSSIAGRSISNDGNWLMYTVRPAKGDAILKIREVETDKQYTVQRGSLARFTFDSRFAAYLVQPDPKAVKQARKEKKNGPQLPKASLEILELATGQHVSIERVKSFAVPAKAAGWIAYLLEPPVSEGTVEAGKSNVSEEVQIRARSASAKPSAGESSKATTEETKVQTEVSAKKASQSADEASQKKKQKEKPLGTVLALRNLVSGTETRYPNALAYRFSEHGQRLAWTASATEGKDDGVFVVALNKLKLRTLASGRGNYRGLTFDEAGEQVAFLSDRDDFEAEQPAWSVFYAKVAKKKKAKAVASAGSKGVHEDWRISTDASLSFSKNGKRLFFGTAPRTEPEKEKEEQKEESVEADTEDDKPVKVDIWHWKDPYIQPMQLLRASQERRRSYRAVVHLKTSKIVQLATQDVPTVAVGSEQNADIALGLSNLQYRKQRSWDSPENQDAYLVDVKTGERSLVLEKARSRPRLSPEAKYVVWWDGEKRAWFGMSVDERMPRNLTNGIPYPVHDELHDTPSIPRSYGIAGWLTGDKALLVYDKYDIWIVDPDGTKSPRCLTEEFGRKSELRFRYTQLDPEERAIDNDQPLLLSAFHLKSKASGYYRDQMQGHGRPEKLVLMDERMRVTQKARDSNAILLTRSTFQRYPDLWSSTTDFAQLRRISDVNPQQRDYLWGQAELVQWESRNGHLLQGILIKPEGFGAKKTYPLLVYFYERNSDNLHRYVNPAADRASVNYSFYASRGYVIFVPDIQYDVGQPGQSALNAIMPGVQKLIRQGFIDKNRIGVQGHSWGGYQVAYLITKTNLFTAAEAGAPVSNMTSAYGGIRWSSGMSRMFQYEKTQSRIGATLWEARNSYLENSPLFEADQVETPLLILHNDKDGAVPWYQGIELFVALRRLSKPVWLINYNDEAHGLTQAQNRKDFAVRMQQFFDHYLKGNPAPVWLAKGVPAINKGKTLGLELVKETKAKED